MKIGDLIYDRHEYINYDAIRLGVILKISESSVRTSCDVYWFKQKNKTARFGKNEALSTLGLASDLQKL